MTIMHGMRIQLNKWHYNSIRSLNQLMPFIDKNTNILLKFYLIHSTVPELWRE
jgi:hypothetical protein